MKKEVDNWLRQAQSDLIAAGNSLKSKNYDWSCFQAQQAAEKALKALYLQTFKEIRKVHDLTFLAKKLEFPDELLNSCIRLNKVYLETRYPNAEEEIPALKLTEKDAKNSLEDASSILKWLTKKLSIN